MLPRVLHLSCSLVVFSTCIECRHHSPPCLLKFWLKVWEDIKRNHYGRQHLFIKWPVWFFFCALMGFQNQTLKQSDWFKSEAKIWIARISHFYFLLMLVKLPNTPFQVSLHYLQFPLKQQRTRDLERWIGGHILIKSRASVSGVSHLNRKGLVGCRFSFQPNIMIPMLNLNAENLE